MARNRLNELLKQRALIEEHLAWLESEINALQSESLEIPVAEPSPSPIPANRLEASDAFETLVDPNLASTETAAADPDPKAVVSDLYDELGPETQSSVNDARKGCVTLFVGAFLVLAAIAAWVWWKY